MSVPISRLFAVVAVLSGARRLMDGRHRVRLDRLE